MTATTSIAFTRGVPPIEAIPLEDLALHTAAALAEGPAGMFQYAPIGRHCGNPTLRKLIGEMHAADPGVVFVGNGSLQVLDLLAAHLLSGANREVWVEAPTYDRAAHIFCRRGGRVIGIPLEADGLDLEALRGRLTRGAPAFLYTIPDFQNPSGVTMSEPKRDALVALAAESGFRIIEDTPYRALRFRGSAPSMLRELAGPGHVITIGSFSKVLSPGLRVGYAVSDADTTLAVASLADDTYLSPAPLCQAVAARCLASGVVGENVARVCDLLRPRHDAAVAAVRREFGDDVLLAVPDGGYFLSLELPIAADEADLIDAALDRGVALTPGSGFAPHLKDARGVFLRLPFQALSSDEFADGAHRLAAAIEHVDTRFPKLSTTSQKGGD